MPSIEDFADIGEFIDRPVKEYSSGMYVRLAFATAINVDPEILVVDEALAVGDAAFQRKCFARIEEMQARGTTILFVSHSTQTVVQLCSRALLIDGGELLLDGTAKTVVSQYQRLVNLSLEEGRLVREEIRKLAVEIVPAHNANCSAPAQQATADPHPTAAPIYEGFDPGLGQRSRVDYETHGATIRKLRRPYPREEQVNILFSSADPTRMSTSSISRPRPQKSGSACSSIRQAASASAAPLPPIRPSSERPGSLPALRCACALSSSVDFCRGTYSTPAYSAPWMDRSDFSIEFDALAFRVAPANELVATMLVDLHSSRHRGAPQRLVTR